MKKKIEIPKGCEDCRFYYSGFNKGHCALYEKVVYPVCTTGKPPWCVTKEIEIEVVDKEKPKG